MKPEIRFNGFNDEWNIAKLGDVLKIPEKVEATVTNNEQLLTVKLHGGGVHEMPANKLLKLGSTKYYVRKAGQLIYGKQNFFNGSIAIIPLELDGKASSGDVPSFDIVNADPVYLYQKISQPEFYKRTEDWASGTGSKRLHEKTIQQFPIQLPTLPEQQKIGGLFSKYDAIIALREQKLAELDALKKGLLQQMFPKNGAKVPELRFAGFADDWEECKLGEITNRVTRKNKDNESNRILTISAEEGLVDQIEYFNKQIASRDLSRYFLMKNGEFAYNKSYSKGYPWGAIKRLDKYDMGVLSSLYIVFQPKNIDSQFLVSYYDTTAWYKEVSMNATEGARNHGLLNIAPIDFFNTVLNVASLPEQQKIGQLFKHLDARISNEQVKIEQLKDQKQGLLQRMLTN